MNILMSFLETHFSACFDFAKSPENNDNLMVHIKLPTIECFPILQTF